jgi:hypothetical protein
MLFFVVMNLENRIAPSREYLGAAKKLLVGLILSAVSWNFSAYATKKSIEHIYSLLQEITEWQII